MRAIDFHVHLPTIEWMEGSMGAFRSSAEKYFRKKIDLKTMDKVAEEYEALDIVGVVLGWDAETFTGAPPLSNDEVARIPGDFPDRFIAFAGIDPHKPSAITEMRRCIEDLGMKGVKLHPSLQNFDPSDERFRPLWETAQSLSVPCIFHTGTSGIGAGMPGGQGIRLDLARPILLDPVAAAFPELVIVMAHFGWPWHLEALAIALHKSNVYLDISGWAPKYLPKEVVADMKGRLSHRFLWGSDYPFIDPSRCLKELSELDLGPAEEPVLKGNAISLLRLQ